MRLPSLSEAVPSSWVTIEDNFYLVYATNLSLLDPMTLLAPASRVDDGVIYLVLVRSTMRRLEKIHNVTLEFSIYTKISFIHNFSIFEG